VEPPLAPVWNRHWPQRGTAPGRSVEPPLAPAWNRHWPQGAAGEGAQNSFAKTI